MTIKNLRSTITIKRISHIKRSNTIQTIHKESLEEEAKWTKIEEVEVEASEVSEEVTEEVIEAVIEAVIEVVEDSEEIE
jgi:hypothetical protein